MLATLSRMLPPAPTVSEATSAVEARGLRRRRWALIVAVVLLTSSVIGAAVLPVPYEALRPGSVRPVKEQLKVGGVPSYPPTGSIGFTTVTVGSTTLLEALAGWLDDDVDVLPKDRVLGGRSEDENRRYNAQLMDTSKLTAIAVALRYLGEKVSIRTSGVVVRQVVERSPAAAALELDDVIVAVDGTAVDAPDELGDLLQPGGPGATHSLTLERPAGSNHQIKVEVTTIEAPDDVERAIIGIAELEDRIVDYDFPIDVTIDSGTVGGPSAGLAFTLAVLDVLTSGELTGGHKVAVTGTMALDGTVGPVGGGAQKAIAVRDAGYDTFLVPLDELAEVREAVGHDVRVIAVGSLEEALLALDSIGGNARSLLAATPIR